MIDRPVRPASAEPPSTGAPPAPPAAELVFGAEMDRARAYADLLCTVGLLRGLIGPREPARIWDRHLLNCAQTAKLIPAGAQVIDVGSGAGLPGVPLQLARPDLHVTLVEPLARRTQFLAEVVHALELTVPVQRTRAENVAPASADVVVCRAVAPLTRLIPLVWPIIRPGGALIALKGATAQVEIEEAAPTLAEHGAGRASVVHHRTGTATATMVHVERPTTGRGA